MSKFFFSFNFSSFIGKNSFYQTLQNFFDKFFRTIFAKIIIFMNKFLNQRNHFIDIRIRRKIFKFISKMSNESFLNFFLFSSEFYRSILKFECIWICFWKLIYFFQCDFFHIYAWCFVSIKIYFISMLICRCYLWYDKFNAKKICKT